MIENSFHAVPKSHYFFDKFAKVLKYFLINIRVKCSPNYRYNSIENASTPLIVLRSNYCGNSRRDYCVGNVQEIRLQSLIDAAFTFVSLFLIAVLHTSASLALNESWDPDVRWVLY